MDAEHLTIETDPAPEDVRFLNDRLYEYNVAQTGVDDGQWLAIFLRDDQGMIRAGIHGWTWCGTAYISTFWILDMLPAVYGEDSHLWEVVPCFSETAQGVFGLVFAPMAPRGGFYAGEATRKPPRSHGLSTGLTSPMPLGRGLGR